MKISIFGAGNVGSLTAMRLAQENLGEVILCDIAKGLAEGKAFDMEDARAILKQAYRIKGSDDPSSIKDSDIIVITAGIPRKPGMSREDLVNTNARIMQSICAEVKRHAPGSLVIVVTNPLDIMTRLALDRTDFKPTRVFGMGITLDAARFANLIAGDLKIPVSDVEATVIGSHGEGMLPLPRFTTVKGVSLEEFLDAKALQWLVSRTVERGAQIVSLLGSGSAYFAPSAAIAAIVRAIAKDEKRTLGVSAYLNGQYGIKDACIGVPCRLGREGIEEIIEIALNKHELELLRTSALNLKTQYGKITV